MIKFFTLTALLATSLVLLTPFLSNAQRYPGTGLEAHYRFRSPGGIFEDSSGNGYNLQVGSISPTADAYGVNNRAGLITNNALLIDSAARLGRRTIFNDSAFAVVLRMKRGALVQLGARPSALEFGGSFYVSSNPGQHNEWIVGWSTAISSFSLQAGPASENEWTLLTIKARRGAGNAWRLVITNNGREVQNVTLQQGAPVVNTGFTTAGALGGSTNLMDNAKKFFGVLDDVALYSTATVLDAGAQPFTDLAAPVLHYKMEGNLNNSVGSVGALTATHTPVYEASTNGLGAAYKNQGGEIARYNGTTIVPTNSFTLSCWFNHTGGLVYPTMIEVGNNLFLRLFNGRVQTGYLTQGGTFTIATQGGASLNGVWNHAAAVYNATNNTFSLYINGEKIAAQSPGIPDFSALGRHITVGCGLNNGAPDYNLKNFVGNLDEVLMYHLPLGDHEIRMLFNKVIPNTSGPSTQPVVLNTSTNTRVCFGSPATASIVAINATSYQWLRNGILAASAPNRSGINASQLSINAVTLADTGTWTCQAMNSTDTVVSSPIRIDIEARYNVLITPSGNTLQAPGSIDHRYSWIDCSTGLLAIGTRSGQLGENFTPLQNGTYGVIMLNNITQCADTSICVSVTLVSLQDNLANSIKLYPNPAQNHVQVSSGTGAILKMVLTNSLGQKQHISYATHTNTKGDNSFVQLEGLPTGLYYMHIETELGKTVLPLSIKP